ncbi:ThuA domain-containing protein [Fulvivirgaceae bacterium BMA10]|uniref:ThuA domain-containing protein n=1 Tax=Splendidivirga corallicola TaxID=3051826 RepID=A0ABT8KW92_9BACT|nr:ThuA domain-containing protein [Fulvivirgaceae bacterium BMA10]
MLKKLKKFGKTTLAVAVLTGCFFSCDSNKRDEKRILVFSKTAGFRHGSIGVGKTAIQKLGSENDFKVDTTENAEHFTEENLTKYSAVVFLNTTMDILDHYQQADFERYIQAGGGFVGVHAASDTEYHWPWYNKLVGGYFASHPRQQDAILNVVDKNHISTEFLPDQWKRFDEWYNFKSLNLDVNVLITIDENSYEGGANGEHHPMAWYHEYDGGRAFYTALGHTKESYEDSLFLKHLLGGIQWAIGENKLLDYSKAHSQRVPEENRFTKVVLDFNLNEPTEMAVFNDERILFIERKGKVKLYKPDLDSTFVIADFDVYHEQEDGMMGLALDPNYEQNNWVYIFYSPPGDEPKQHLSRFEMIGDSLILESEIVMLEVPVQRDECCHTGGSMAFDPSGNLYLSTGDDTNPFESDGYAPIDERPGRGPWDAQKSSANTNDLRGKILRIHPEPDGTYTIPEGNLFPEGTPNTRPEIFVMGCRNPYRISVDKKTGVLYWGDVGPDAGKDSETRGPKGLDEINRAEVAGFYGWPYFRGNNQAYADYNFATKEVGDYFNPKAPINDSPFNTGLRELPPSQKSLIWYSYDKSGEFPIVKTGGKNPMAGPVFYSDMYPGSKESFPSYFNNKLFIYEWMRGWIIVVTFNENNELEKLEPFMPNTEFNNPIDLEMGPNGNMYLLEYGTGWFTQNKDARLCRIEYNDGNRPPIVELSADKTIGSAPLSVNFSAEGTIDYDNDALSYEWKFVAGGELVKEKNTSFTFNEPGIHKTRLRVTDAAGNVTTREIDIKVGNEPSEIAINIQGNRSFYWNNRKLQYNIEVADKEDGSLGNGIEVKDILVDFNYLDQGYDKTLVAQGHQIKEEPTISGVGKTLIDGSDCKACHKTDEKSIGPSYMQVAEKYAGKDGSIAYLADKIISGGGGVWGEQAMAAHPQISQNEAKEIVKYILSLKPSQQQSKYPTEGSYTTNEHLKTKNRGAYFIHAAYRDKGGDVIGPLTSEKTTMLRFNEIAASQAADKFKTNNFIVDNKKTVGLKHGSYLTFEHLDLTGIKSLTLGLGKNQNAKTGKIEIRIGSPDGKLIGSQTVDGQGSIKASTINIESVNDYQDIYIVGASEEDTQNILFGVSDIRFDVQ